MDVEAEVDSVVVVHQEAVVAVLQGEDSAAAVVVVVVSVVVEAVAGLVAVVTLDPVVSHEVVAVVEVGAASAAGDGVNRAWDKHPSIMFCGSVIFACDIPYVTRAGQIFGVQEQKGRGVWFIRKICAQKRNWVYYASTSLEIRLKNVSGSITIGGNTIFGLEGS